MNVSDLPKWLAGHRPMPSKVTAIVAGKEQSLALGVASQRWVRLANVLATLGADEVRLYDKDGDLLGSMGIDEGKPRDGDAPARFEGVGQVQLPILKDASDVNSLVHALAQAFSQVVRDVSAAQADAHKTAFHELQQVVKSQTDQIRDLRKLADDSLEQRAEDLAVREEEAQQSKAQDALIGKLIDHAGPEIVKKVFNSGGDKPNGETVKK